MNLRHPKVIRLGGWGAGLATLLVVAACAYLAMTFFQSGDVLNAGILGGVAGVVALIGGLLSYCLFVLARMQPAPTEAAAEASSEPEAAVSVVETPADEDEAIAISVANSTLPPPELSDDAIPVFASAAGADDSVADLLVVPPPLDAVDDSDSISVERSVSGEDFDSRMDLPVTIDVPELDVEELDEVPPAVESQTTPVVSSLTQTEEVDVLEIPEAVTPEPERPKPAPVAARPSPVDAFPDIFKSAMPKAAPAVSAVPIAPPPAPQKLPTALPATMAPAAEAGPAAPKAQPAPAAAEESLPVVDDLEDIAITLGPVTPTGVLPTEIPDFFLKMPTGRATPPPPPVKPLMPVAPVAPRQVAPPKAAHQAQAVVRIIDSTSSANEGDDLMTMTAIPDDWPS